MRRIIAFLVAATFATAGGCYRLVPQSHFEYLEAFDESVVTDYEEYVDQDKNLTALQKENRKANVHVFRDELKEYTK